MTSNIQRNPLVLVGLSQLDVPYNKISIIACTNAQFISCEQSVVPLDEKGSKK